MVKRRRKVEVDWIPDHESFRAVFGQSYPVVSDRDLLRAVVDLANGDTATVDSDDATHSYRANTFLERVQDGIGFKEANSVNTIDEAIAQYGAPRIVARAVDDYLRERVAEYSTPGSTVLAGIRASDGARLVVKAQASRLAADDATTTPRVLPANRPTVTASAHELAATSPYQSEEMAKMAEQILRAKDGAS